MIEGYYIAVACIIGPPLFFALGWHCCHRHKRSEYRAAMETRHPEVKWTAGKGGVLTSTVVGK